MNPLWKARETVPSELLLVNIANAQLVLLPAALDGEAGCWQVPRGCHPAFLPFSCHSPMKTLLCELTLPFFYGGNLLHPPESSLFDTFPKENMDKDKIKPFKRNGTLKGECLYS